MAQNREAIPDYLNPNYINPNEESPFWIKSSPKRSSISVPPEPMDYTPAPINVDPPSQADINQASDSMPALSAQDLNPNYYEQILSKMNSPEYQSLQQELNDRSKQAISSQQQGISQNEKDLNDVKEKGQAINWEPLVSYVNSTTGSNLNSGYKPENPDDYKQKILGLQNVLQTQKQGLSKEQIDAIKTQMDMMNPLKNMGSLARIGQRDDMLGFRQDQMAAQAVKDIDNHPLMQTATKQLGQLQIDRHTIENSKIVPYQVLHEISNGIANALSGGRGVGLGMAEMQDLSTSQSKMAQLESYITNNPHEAASPAIKRQIIDTLNRLEDSYGEYQSRLAQKLAQGRTYEHNPQAQRALQSAVAKYGYTKKYNNNNNKTSKAPSTVHPVDQMSDEEVIKAYNEKMRNK